MILHTMKGTYQKVYASDFSAWTSTKASVITADVSKGYLDSTKPNRSFSWANKPIYAIEVGPEWNYLECVVPMYSCITSGDGGFRMYGYAEYGPAELIADISIKASRAFIDDATANVWCGGMTILFNNHIGDVTTTSVTADASHRIAKLRADVAGYKYIFFDPYDLTDAEEKLINFWIRPY